MKKTTIKELDSKNSKFRIIKVSTPWCGYCKVMEAVTEPTILKNWSDKVEFYTIDADQEQLWETKSKYNVSLVPTYFMEKDGKIIDRKVAFVPIPIFEDWIKNNL